MAYCRFFECDVYFYLSSEGYECCACRLAPKVRTKFTTGDKFLGCGPCEHCNAQGCEHCMMHGSANFKTTQEAIDHLLAHREAGHYVPNEAIDELRAELTAAPPRGT